MSSPAASSSEIYVRAFRAGLTPDALLTVEEWADSYRRLSGVASAEPGPWRTDRTPYLRKIMESLSSSGVERVVFMKRDIPKGSARLMRQWVAKTGQWGVHRVWRGVGHTYEGHPDAEVTTVAVPNGTATGWHQTAENVEH